MATAIAIFIVGAMLLVLIAPGVLLVSAACPAKSLPWRWTTGATLGLAAGVYVCFILSYEDIYLFAPAWATIGLCCIWFWRRKGAGGRPSLLARPSRMGWMLLIVLALIAILRIGTVAGREVPRGWDPSFHMILTQKILLSHRIITDWEPFEAIALNYPLGSHTLIAALAGTTALPPHQVFNLLLPMIGVLLTAEVYALAVAATRRHGLGLLAAIAFGFLALLGSIDYVRWGGMPNAIGMLFLLCFLRLLIEREFAARRWIMALLVAALILVHHHVMLTACIIMAGLLAWALLRRDWRTSAAILFSGVCGSILATPHVIPYLMKAQSLASTAVLDYETQPPLWAWLPAIGWVFAPLAIAGVALHGWRWITRRQPAHSAQIHWVVPGVTFILVLLYIATGIIYPAWQQARGNQPLGAFTPSRFLTDVVPLAAIFAGYAMYWIVQNWPFGLRFWHVAALGMGGTITLLPAWKSISTQDYPAPLVRAYQWISQNTPPQTIVLTTDAWAPYLSWRKTMQTPVPVSEPQSYHEDERLLAEYVETVLHGQTAPASADLTLVRIRQPSETPGGRPSLHEEDGYAVEQVWPAK